MKGWVRKAAYMLASLSFTAVIGLPALVNATAPEVQYEASNSNLEDDDNYTDTQKPIGFTFNFYGTDYTAVDISTNGAIMFDSPSSEYDNTTLPTNSFGSAILPFWDDLYTGPAKSIYYYTVGSPGSRKFIVQWTNTAFCCDLESPMGSFQAILYEGSNKIQFQYRNLVDIARARGDSATIGIQKDNTTANQYSNNTDTLVQGDAISFVPDGLGGYTDNGHADTYDPVYLVVAGLPAKPELTSPTGGSTDVSINPTFTWTAANLADEYWLAVATDEAFANVEFSADNLTSTTYSDFLNTLSNSTTYYWRVVAKNAVGYTYSDIHSFTTTATPNQVPANVTSIGPNTLTTGATVNPVTLLSTPFSFDVNDPDNGDQVRYEVEFTTTNNPTDVATIDYISDLGAQGGRKFSYGQSGGTYSAGTKATRFVDGQDYYFFVRAIDEHGAASDWASSGSPAFTYSSAPSDDSDSTPAATEDGAPNSGDANNDGFPDSWQTNVSGFVNPVTNAYSVLQVDGADPGDCTNQSAAVAPETAQATQDGAYNYPAGLMNFTIECANPGATAKITQYFFGNYTGTLVARKYNPVTKTYTTIANAQIGTTTVGGQAAVRVEYFVTDGGVLDQDGTANGTIVDPSGPAVLGVSVTAPNSGLKATNLTPFITSSIFGVALVMVVIGIQRRRDS